MATPKPAKSAEKKAGTESGDTALVYGRSADGGLQILRKRSDSLEAGTVYPLQEGKPITGEVVQLKPRPEHPLLCDVEVQYSPAQPSSAAGNAAKPQSTQRARSNKPPHVTSSQYRSNWGDIWDKPKKKSKLLN